MVASPMFRRFSSGGSFFVNYTISSDIDVIPPSRIIDFRRSSKSSGFDNNPKYVSFEWTAPGNDFVFGKATQYNIECFGSNTEEITFDKSQLPQPDVYGARQSVTVQIAIVNQVLLCTIFASDEVMFNLYSSVHCSVKNNLVWSFSLLIGPYFFNQFCNYLLTSKRKQNL